MPVTYEELPDTIKRSPKKVQRTYKKVLDNAHDQYSDLRRRRRQ